MKVDKGIEAILGSSMSQLIHSIKDKIFIASYIHFIQFFLIYARSPKDDTETLKEAHFKGFCCLKDSVIGFLY